MIRKAVLTIWLLSAFCFSQTNISGSVNVSGNITVAGPGTQIVISSIALSPPNPFIPYVNSQAFTALATYTNGSTGDVTSVATWASSNQAVATGGGVGLTTFQCVGRGTSTISAVYQGVTGTTVLTCESPTFTPQGTFNAAQGNAQVTVVQFTGANGSSPYTFSSPDLPAWLSLSSTGCAAGQVNCSLVGTPSQVGLWSFHIQLTDNLGHTACGGSGCTEQVNVTAASAEDNTYCTLTNGVETVVGLVKDGPANPLQNCNYTALAGTPTTPADVIYVCPQSQTSGGVSVTGCANTTVGATPAAGVCYPNNGTFPEYCPSITAAMLYVYNGGGTPVCGDIQVYATNTDAASGSQNIYTEPDVMLSLPGRINCGPDYGRNWLWLRTKQYANLPPAGNRVTPSWAGVASITGRPNYAQTTDFGIAAGIYMPMLRCEETANGACAFFDAIASSAEATDQLASGMRVMGIVFAPPHNRDTGTDLWGNHVCPTSFGVITCQPGVGAAMIQVGCPGATCGIGGTQTGSRHVIYDRVLLSGCDDLTLATCFGVAQIAIQMEGGQHLSLIDSFLMHSTCLYAIGPCVESHGFSGGNVQNGVNDTGTKIVNNYIESTGEDFFFGGASSASGIYPTDIEIRRNHLFKPLLWKADDPSFPGQVYDAWVNKQGSGYSGAATCSMDPPTSGTTAQCTVTVVGGAITDVKVCPTAPCAASSPAGSGYGLITKSNGNTAQGRPGFYFTDGGTTYASCQNEPAGNVNTNGTDVAWVHGNKFVPGMVGTNITIGTTNYLVSVFNSNTDLTISTSAGVQTNVAYQANLPSRGDCVYAMVGLYNIKNNGEFKHGIRVLLEGNVFENSWPGQSDQDGQQLLISPKNANNGCPTCTVQDMVVRYNVMRGSNKGISISAVPATQGQTLPGLLARVSVHDDLIDAMNGPYYTAGTSPIQSTAGGAIVIENANSPATATQNIFINHVTAIATLPAGYSLNGGYLANIQYNCQYPLNNTLPAPMQYITIENTIGAGGVKNYALKSKGCFNCTSNSCSTTPTETALRQLAVNDNFLPVSGSTYSKGQIAAVLLSNGYVTTNGTDVQWVSGEQFVNGLTGFGIQIGWPQSTTYTVASVNSPTDLTLTSSAGVNTNVAWWATGVPNVNLTGGTCSVVPTSVSLIGGGCTTNCATAGLTAGTNKVSSTFPKTTGSGYTSAPSVQFNGGTCSVQPTAMAYIEGVGTPKDSSWCFDHNVMPTLAWNGILSMAPYPTSQGDAANNSCASQSGGHNNTDFLGNPLTIQSWADVKFQNWTTDANGAECDGHHGCDPPDLHLSVNSPFHNTANDGTDIGANMDKVIGKEDGTPSQYTGCYILGGYHCPP